MGVGSVWSAVPGNQPVGDSAGHCMGEMVHHWKMSKKGAVISLAFKGMAWTPVLRLDFEGRDRARVEPG